MKRQGQTLLGALFFVSFLSPLFAGDIQLARRDNIFDEPPAPELIFPITDRVELTGKDVFEFKWWNTYVDVDHFEFRLYQGSDMYAANLIDSQKIPGNQSSIQKSADLFEDGKVYTWSLRQVTASRAKSDRAFQTFRVIKKKE